MDAETDSTDPGRAGALRLAVIDLEQHVARGGWDAPVAVFALVRTNDAVERSPELADQLPSDALALARDNPHHLTSIEQDGLPSADDLEQLLAQLAWPETVDGAAVVVERIVVPPEAAAEADAMTVEQLMEHPQRQDVRIAVGVLRTGESWCALRTRAHDSDDAVGGSPDAVPGLVEALRATFAP
ncbi:MAG TPA: PPA1309 family protein [Actinotalea caeni]|uniref:PPA1309 family protein n=1 Tax=Actinotalea caeni TaxID=1348467 RepID=UPI0012E118A3|nr:PPA1309 family protein [Actinotalea caeni]HLV54785.1 PPA1309 family protein [Actinotalea caeni]